MFGTYIKAEENYPLFNSLLNSYSLSFLYLSLHILTAYIELEEVCSADVDDGGVGMVVGTSANKPSAHHPPDLTPLELYSLS